jgi:hypothetical protein
MPDEKPGQSIQKETVQQVAATEPVNPPTPAYTPYSETAQQQADTKVQRDVQGIEDRIRHAERWMIGLTIAIAFFALCSVVVGILQWNAMNGQLSEMRSGSVDTGHLVEATQKQAGAAAQQVGSMAALAINARNQADRTKDLADRMKDQADRTRELVAQSRVSADATKSAADTAAITLRQSQEAFALETRPLVWVRKFDSTDMTNGRPTLVNITFVNGGKGIARNIDSKDRNFVVAESEKGALARGAVFSDSTPNRGTSLPPGEPLFITVAGTLSVADVRDIIARIKHIYVFGSLIYSDANNVRHRTNWCTVIIPEGHSFGECQYANDMN